MKQELTLPRSCAPLSDEEQLSLCGGAPVWVSEISRRAEDALRGVWAQRHTIVEALRLISNIFSSLVMIKGYARVLYRSARSLDDMLGIRLR